MFFLILLAVYKLISVPIATTLGQFPIPHFKDTFQQCLSIVCEDPPCSQRNPSSNLSIALSYLQPSHYEQHRTTSLTTQSLYIELAMWNVTCYQQTGAVFMYPVAQCSMTISGSRVPDFVCMADHLFLLLTAVCMLTIKYLLCLVYGQAVDAQLKTMALSKLAVLTVATVQLYYSYSITISSYKSLLALGLMLYPHIRVFKGNRSIDWGGLALFLGLSVVQLCCFGKGLWMILQCAYLLWRTCTKRYQPTQHNAMMLAGYIVGSVPAVAGMVGFDNYQLIPLQPWLATILMFLADGTVLCFLAGVCSKAYRRLRFIPICVICKSAASYDAVESICGHTFHIECYEENPQSVVCPVDSCPLMPLQPLAKIRDNITS